MKKIYLLLLIIFPFFVVAQEKLSYNTKTEKIDFNVSKEYYFVKSDSKQNSFLESKSGDEYYKIRDNYSIIKFSGGKSLDFQQRLIAVQERYEGKLIQIDPVLIFEDGTKQICKGEMIIKFKNAETINQLFNDYSFNVEKDEFVENQYLIEIEGLSTIELFNLVDKFKNIENIEFVEPNFIRLIKPLTNDAFFADQWAINNQGHFSASVVGADMDVDDAWPYSTGYGAKVAILDEGVDLNHPDLASNLLSGYDATDQDLGGAPNYSNDDTHGTACAGIVAAVANNNIGIAGIAYNAKIIPVRIAYSNGFSLYDERRDWISEDSWIANGINWAVQNEADILSNS